MNVTKAKPERTIPKANGAKTNDKPAPVSPAPVNPVPVKPQSPPPTELKKPVNAEDLQCQLDLLKNLVFEHNRQIIDLQEAVARKRKAAPNGKVKIRDKETGKIYPSKNNAYQSLLRSGALKALVAKGIFGDVPEKNTFGWYALKRELPDRFEEITGEGDGKAEPVPAPVAK